MKRLNSKISYSSEKLVLRVSPVGGHHFETIGLLAGEEDSTPVLEFEELSSYTKCVVPADKAESLRADIVVTIDVIGERLRDERPYMDADEINRLESVISGLESAIEAVDEYIEMREESGSSEESMDRDTLITKVLDLGVGESLEVKHANNGHEFEVERRDGFRWMVSTLGGAASCRTPETVADRLGY